MPENEDEDSRFNTYVISSLAVTSALLLLLPMAFVIGKDTAYSAYEEDDFYQLSDMRYTSVSYTHLTLPTNREV